MKHLIQRGIAAIVFVAAGQAWGQLYEQTELESSDTNQLAIGTLACDPTTAELTPERYLRALSLDLRGTVP